MKRFKANLASILALTGFATIVFFGKQIKEFNGELALLLVALTALCYFISHIQEQKRRRHTD